MFGQDKPDVYGRVSLGAEVVETSVASNSVEAAWTQWAEWLVEEVAGHVGEVNMWDRSGLVRSGEVRRGQVRSGEVTCGTCAGTRPAVTSSWATRPWTSAP